jgi:hypothetical protein
MKAASGRLFYLSEFGLVRFMDWWIITIASAVSLEAGIE